MRVVSGFRVSVSGQQMAYCINQSRPRAPAAPPTVQGIGAWRTVNPRRRIRRRGRTSVKVFSSVHELVFAESKVHHASLQRSRTRPLTSDLVHEVIHQSINRSSEPFQSCVVWRNLDFISGFVSGFGGGSCSHFLQNSISSVKVLFPVVCHPAY